MEDQSICDSLTTFTLLTDMISFFGSNINLEITIYFLFIALPTDNYFESELNSSSSVLSLDSLVNIIKHHLHLGRSSEPYFRFL